MARVPRVAALLALVAAVAAVPTFAASGRRDARVRGLVEWYQGPGPTIGPMRGAGVTVLDGRGATVARQRTATGRFSFKLHPGRYTVVATANGFRGARERRSVRARAHRTAYVYVFYARPSPVHCTVSCPP